MKKFTEVLKKLVSPTIAFHLMVFFSIAFLFLFKYIPNMDAPQHLYNAEVIKQILLSNDTFQEFFRVNPVIVGYWTGHFVLTLFLLFLPAFMAEKAMLIVYIVSISYAFKYLVTSNGRKLNYTAFLIFPFSYSFYMLSGYYSFSFAAVFFFLIVGFYLRNENNLNIKNIVLLSLLFLGSFLSHAFVFALTALSIFIFWFVNAIFDFINKENNPISQNVKKALSILASAIPALVLFIIYILHIRTISSAIAEQPESTTLLIKHLFKIRPLIGFNFDIESTSTYVYFFLLLAFGAYIVWQNITKRVKIISKTNIWIIVTIFFAALYLLFPDRVTAGNLTHRISLYMFFNLIIWVNLNKVPKWLALAGVILLIAFFAKQRLYHAKVYKGLNKTVAEIEEVRDMIEPNSTLTHIIESNNWLHGHFACYAAIDNPSIYLFNPQVKGKFPVVWQYDKMPLVYRGNHLLKLTPKELSSDYPRDVKIVDYIVVFDHKLYQKTEEYKNRKPLFDEFYELVKESNSKRVALYRFKYHDQLAQMKEQVENDPKSFIENLQTKDRNLNLTKNGKLTLVAYRSLIKSMYN
jgi:hypothetical protein